MRSCKRSRRPRSTGASQLHHVSGHDANGPLYNPLERPGTPTTNQGGRRGQALPQQLADATYTENPTDPGNASQPSGHAEPRTEPDYLHSIPAKPGAVALPLSARGDDPDYLRSLQKQERRRRRGGWQEAQQRSESYGDTAPDWLHSIPNRPRSDSAGAGSGMASGVSRSATWSRHTRFVSECESDLAPRWKRPARSPCVQVR
jgi:hypothetical protein